MKGQNYIRKILRQMSDSKSLHKDDIDFAGSVLEVVDTLPSPQKEELFVGLVLLRDQRRRSGDRRLKAAA